MNTSVPLGDLLLPARVERAGKAEFPVLSMTMNHGLVPQSGRFKKRIASSDLTGYKVVQHGQLVVGFPIDEGVLDFQLRCDAAIVSPAYTVWDLRDDRLVDRAYLRRFLTSPRAIEYYAAKLKGSTARRRSLPSTEFKAMPVPLPPLPEQRRIAAILDHADAIRAKRRQVLAHLDVLQQSLFTATIEEGDYPTYALGDIATFVGGASLPQGEPFEGQQHGTLLMKVSDMNSSGNEQIVRTTALWTSANPRASTTTAGAVVFPKRGASIATNKKRVTERPTSLDPNLMAVEPSRQHLTTQFLLYWFNSFDLTTIASGSAVPQLNKRDLAPLRVPLPPITVQRRFAARVAQIARWRTTVQGTLAADDELFASLQSRAFRGEL